MGMLQQHWLHLEEEAWQYKHLSLNSPYVTIVTRLPQLRFLEILICMKDEQSEQDLDARKQRRYPTSLPKEIEIKKKTIPCFFLRIF